VLAVASVESVGYDPAEQRLEAVVHDTCGTAVLIRADFNPAAPGGLDALAEALGGGRVRFVSGLLRRDGGRPVLDPLAVLTRDGLVLPDLARGDGSTALAPAAPRAADALTGALTAALAALAELAHTGLRACGSAARDRLGTAAGQLRRAGLHTGAALVDALVHGLAADGADAALPAWVDAVTHVVVALELHQGTGGQAWHH
jgi:hypothetical protein